MSDRADSIECRVLILAPIGADAENMRTVLSHGGFTSSIQPDLTSTLAAVTDGCGVLLMTEEALEANGHARLVERLSGQPPWSDLPVVVIVSGARKGGYTAQLVKRLGPGMNLALIERPLRIPTLIAAVNTALRARRRQYELRDMLAERQRLMLGLEERVAERTERLRTMIEELEAFSYSVSHDLRGPLNVIGGYAQVLIEDHEKALTSEARDLLQRIVKTVRRMDQLTLDLLAYTRISREDLTLGPVDLDRVLAEVIEQYPAIMRMKHRITIHGPLGKVAGHPASLVQIFSNLIENSLKFVRRGEEPEVDIRSVFTSDRVRIIVADHGVGIAPEQHERIFGIFERVSRSPFPGTGIGLAIAKKAVERMGGAIGVISELDHGAAFWVELGSVNHFTVPNDRTLLGGSGPLLEEKAAE